ncbi:hypothetical protein D3C87_824830 [compost metagenome]
MADRRIRALGLAGQDGEAVIFAADGIDHSLGVLDHVLGSGKAGRLHIRHEFFPGIVRGCGGGECQR